MNYALVDIKSGAVIEAFGAYPSRAVWPNGDISFCPGVGDERAGARLVAVVVKGSKPGEFYHSTGETASLAGNTLTLETMWEPDDLEGVRNMLLARIDSGAENCRLRLIAEGSGQAMVYLAKQIEARAFASDPAPDPADYPLLAASVVGSGTLADAAKLVSSTASAWMSAAAEIEKVRLSSKYAIRNGKTVDEVTGIAAAVKWPS